MYLVSMNSLIIGKSNIFFNNWAGENGGLYIKI